MNYVQFTNASFIEQISSSEANSHSVGQEIPSHFMAPEGSLSLTARHWALS